MSEKERENFFKAAVSRPPGKRQVKPSAALFESEFGQPISDADDDDLDFTANTHSDSDDELSTDVESGTGESKSGYESELESDDEEDGEIEEKEQEVEHELEATSSSAKKHIKHRTNGLIDTEQDIEIVELTSGHICSVCLSLKPSDHLGELIQCDRCGLSVHENCYGVTNELATEGGNHADAQSMSSSASTEPWFCEPCLLGDGTIPHCELCPSRFGAFKQADIPGIWVHVTCALFTPGIEFSEPDRLSGVNWQNMDYRNFGRKSCTGCTDKLESRTGITVRCDAGFCKNFYHVTCAQRLGLLVENSQPNHHSSSVGMEIGYIYCKRHNHNENAVIMQKRSYAKFIRQEDYRMVEFKNIQLDARQEKKRQAQLQERLKHAEHSRAGHSSDFTQKRAKLLHTSAKYLNAFAEKAELLGLNRQQFEEEFASVPSAYLPIGLPPAFSKAFVGYVEHRDTVLIEEEERGLVKSQKLKDELLQSQAIIEEELRIMKAKKDDLATKCADQSLFFERLKFVLKTLAPGSFVEAKKKLVERKRSLAKVQELPSKKPANEIEEKRKKRDLDESGKKNSKSPQMSSTAIALPPPSSSAYINQQNMPVSLFTKFGFNDKQTKVSPVSTSTSKNQPKLSGPEKASSSKNAKSFERNSPAYANLAPLECHKCKMENDQHLLVFCGTCKHNYHIGCLDPPLERMPVRDKFSRFECSDCACPSEDDDDDEQVEAVNVDKTILGEPSPEDWTLTTMRTRRQAKRKS